MMIQGKEDQIKSLLRSRFSWGEYALKDAFDTAGEGHSVILFRGEGKKSERPLLVVDSPADEILALFLNDGNRGGLERVRLLPRLIFFRVFGEKEKVIEQIAADYSAERGRLRSVLYGPRRGRIAVCFTTNPLNRPIKVDDVMDEILHIEGESFEKLLDSLRSRALWYFSEGLENRQWNELEIRIFDSWGRYLDHYERLRIVIEGLDGGMILGEGWGKDFAHILMAVKVYRLKFLTFLPPSVVKEILIGLEYGADGTRLADFDLYAGKEKISWGDVGERTKERSSMGISLREKLYGRLPPEEKEELEEWERKILAEREE